MKCVPIFSDVDSDLRASGWRTDKHGYPRRSRRIDKKLVSQFAHNLVALRMFASKAGLQVDHRNGDKMDARRENIRLVTAAQNSQAKPKHRFSGTTWHKCGKWQANVRHCGKDHYLGLFSDREEAAGVVAAKRVELAFLERGAK